MLRLKSHRDDQSSRHTGVPAVKRGRSVQPVTKSPGALQLPWPGAEADGAQVRSMELDTHTARLTATLPQCGSQQQELGVPARPSPLQQGTAVRAPLAPPFCSLPVASVVPGGGGSPGYLKGSEQANPVPQAPAK